MLPSRTLAWCHCELSCSAGPTSADSRIDARLPHLKRIISLIFYPVRNMSLLQVVGYVAMNCDLTFRSPVALKQLLGWTSGNHGVARVTEGLAWGRASVERIDFHPPFSFYRCDFHLSLSPYDRKRFGTPHRLCKRSKVSKSANACAKNRALRIDRAFAS